MPVHHAYWSGNFELLGFHLQEPNFFLWLPIAIPPPFLHCTDRLIMSKYTLTVSMRHFPNFHYLLISEHLMNLKWPSPPPFSWIVLIQYKNVQFHLLCKCVTNTFNSESSITTCGSLLNFWSLHSVISHRLVLFRSCRSIRTYFRFFFWSVNKSEQSNFNSRYFYWR